MSVAAAKKPVPKKRHPMEVFAYGAWWKPLTDKNSGRVICPMPHYMIEAHMCRCPSKDKAPPGWLGKTEHFKRFISVIFASPIAKKPFQWNPNACLIVEKYFLHSFVAIAGHGSSGKSEALAVIAIAEFLLDPENTACLITSTTLKESRQRIWGRIEYYWQEAVDYFRALGAELKIPMQVPGELVSSSGMIRYRKGDRKDDTRGIVLVPGRESEVREGIGRMKGFKARRMRFFADELSDLSHKLLEAAESNLFLNQDFKMVGCFNPSSYFDPAGVFSEPEGGWGSINILESEGWKTKRGWCIRFDGETSPNVLARRTLWEGLLTWEKLEDRRKALGDNSPGFMAMYRGAWSETGNKDGIYSEAEIIKYGAMQKVDVWESPAVLCGGFDPSFAHDGDRAVLVISKAGRAICNGVFRSCLEVQQVIYLDENIDTKQDKKELIIQRLKEACLKHGLDPKNLAMDATGGGDVLATLMARDPFFGTKFMRVQFGGAGSGMLFDGRRDKFTNMVSELWYAGKPMLRMGQLKGLKPDIIKDMTVRLYSEEMGGKKRIRVESKADMKKRLNGKSPDVGDSYFLSLFLARSRHGLKSDEKIEHAKPRLDAPQQLDPIKGRFDWGKPKKARINDPDYVPAGGGWADEDSSFGGMFGL